MLILNELVPIEQIKVIILRYEIGDLVNIDRDERGTVNTNYSIEVEREGKRKKYFFRRYKQSIKKAEIEFEHSIIQHLFSKGITFTARLFATREGNSYLIKPDPGATEPSFSALFEYLPGEDLYTWINPCCTRAEFRSSAAVLAQFHRAVADLKPADSRAEPKIVEPGNLKFAKETVVGLLDFDWSKIEIRAFDCALALWYFFTDWDAKNDGRFRLDGASEFLSVYQANLGEGEGLLPLSESEVAMMPV
jgi:homoserine kinase type II